MKKLIILAVLLIGCANQQYSEPRLAVSDGSDITGFYSKTYTIFGATSVQAVQLNADGSGFSCNYSSRGRAINKFPIKHIGNDQWASSSWGTARITKNVDGSIQWGPSVYYPENIENTLCQ